MPTHSIKPDIYLLWPHHPSSEKSTREGSLRSLQAHEGGKVGTEALAYLQGGAGRKGEHSGPNHVKVSRVAYEDQRLVGGDYVEHLEHVSSHAFVSAVDGRLLLLDVDVDEQGG